MKKIISLIRVFDFLESGFFNYSNEDTLIAYGILGAILKCLEDFDLKYLSYTRNIHPFFLGFATG